MTFWTKSVRQIDFSSEIVLFFWQPGKSSLQLKRVFFVYRGKIVTAFFKTFKVFPLFWYIYFKLKDLKEARVLPNFCRIFFWTQVGLSNLVQNFSNLIDFWKNYTEKSKFPVVSNWLFYSGKWWQSENLLKSFVLTVLAPIFLSADPSVMIVCLPVKTYFCDRQLTYLVRNVISSLIIPVWYM